MPISSVPDGLDVTSTRERLASSVRLLRQLEWRVKHPVENTMNGDYRSVFRGRGMEFDQVVKYEFGDDTRTIDWNVTARLGEPFRKKFVEERELMILLVIEDSLSMQFGSGDRTKREAMMEIAGLILLLAEMNKDRIGVVHARPDGYSLLGPSRGRVGILHAASKVIGHPLPNLTDLKPVEIPWKFVARAATKRSLLVWLGDFPPRAQPDGWAALMRRYQPVGIRIEDEWERKMPDGKPLTSYDPASRRLVVLDPNSKSLREGQAAWVAQREAYFNGLFPDQQNRLTVTPHDSMLQSLVRFFHAHMRRPMARA
jgi:uncharacterized protein (DUF58 family)